MLRWSSSSATLWLWQPLSAVFARHTLVVFQCFDTFHNHEAITTLSLGGLLFGGRMAAPPERDRLRRRRAARAARSSLLQVQGVGTRSQDTHHLSSFFLSVSSDTPRCEGACCARTGLRSGWAALSSRSVYIIAAGHLLGSSQDTHTINSLSHMCLAMHLL